MSDLYSLYKLHKLDSAMHSLRQEAAALDTGQDDAKELKALTQAYEEVGGRAKALTTETKDRELQQKAFADKIEHFSKKLYDGSVVSPKEVENIEKEIAMLKELAEKNDERLIELYEEAPPIVKEAEEANRAATAVSERIKEKREIAVARHAEIKSEFDSLKRQRPDVVAEVDAELLTSYENVRKRTGDVAMADVTENGACSQCGMKVPNKQSEMLDEDKVVPCEGCHRILFKAVPTG